jgi:polyhydroxyalkanoate synthesis regulator phasin
MESGKGNDTQRGISENLREAIERTLDEVSRRGQEARDVVAQRGQEAREASVGAASRVAGAIESVRVPTREEMRGIEERLESIERRLHALEARARKEG